MHLATCGRTQHSLDGEWRFTPDPYDHFVQIKAWEHLPEDRRGGACTPEHWPTLAVPGSWNAQREDCTYLEGPAVYWRRFACEAREAGIMESVSKIGINESLLRKIQGQAVRQLIDHERKG